MLTKSVHPRYCLCMAGGGKQAWRGSTSRPPSTGQREGTGGGQESPDSDPCNIIFETILSAINVSELAKVLPGEYLKIEIVTENQVDRLCAKHAGVIVGTIANPRGAEVLACIKAGNEYVARVLSIQGNRCPVRVERM